MKPGVGRVEKKQALVPPIVVLAIALEAIGRGDDRQPAVALDHADRLRVGQGPALGVVVGVEFKDDNLVLRTAGDFFKGVNEGWQRSCGS